ncbi:DUF6000 family protein [Streptomyces antimycoticus]
MALEFRGVSFRYNRKTTVLDGFDLRVSSAATVLLGPNGAGKSMLMALAASQLKPLDGTVTWKGRSPTARRDVTAYRKAVARLPQHITPVPGLTVREQVAYAGWLKGMNRTDAWTASAVTLGRVGLDKLADRRSHQVSGGQLRRLLRMQSPEYDRFVRPLSEDAGVITAEEIATLLEGGWRERRTAAWLVAVSQRTEFREHLSPHLGGTSRVGQDVGEGDKANGEFVPNTPAVERDLHVRFAACRR